ncbi:MAG TPA: hypothetical protein VHH88_05170 [Verrucomicrobiae bacterium]|nr:hypothetical protein [Verrucomicrobiae bacterium]
MKPPGTKCLMATIAMVAIVMASAISGFSQNYSIDWYTIDGGGGTSTGGVYSISGTIGQPDAGHMSGGNYTLDGGFWSIVAAVQTVGAPVLRVVRTATNTVVIAWPAAATGFSLQQNSLLGTVNWTSVTNVPAVVGTENQIIVSPPVGNRFFRLQSP